MARLHLKYKAEAFPPRLLELTERFFMERRRARKTGLGRELLFDTWLHGAAIVCEVPYPSLTMDPKAPTPRGFMGHVGFYDPEGAGHIVLRRWSAISLFHQFRHHMQRFATEGEWQHDAGNNARDAQQWACSLFYQCDKKAFRRWVRKGRVAGVKPEDLLKRKRKAAA